MEFGMFVSWGGRGVAGWLAGRDRVGVRPDMCVPVHIGGRSHRGRRAAGGRWGVPHRAGGQRARARRQGGASAVDVGLTPVVPCPSGGWCPHTPGERLDHEKV